jgi:hypothetical protein
MPTPFIKEVIRFRPDLPKISARTEDSLMPQLSTINEFSF